jgi:hypothetical protein
MTPAARPPIPTLCPRCQRMQGGSTSCRKQLSAADMADLPGGASGLPVRYKGKNADRLVTRIAPGVVSLVNGLRAHERQAAQELEQWKTRVGESKPLDASPAVITLALLLTDEELDSLEKTARVGEIARGGRSGGSDVASPQPAASHGQPAPSIPRQCRGPRRATAVGWRDLVESDPLTAVREIQQHGCRNCPQWDDGQG